ncbi:MAG: DUF4252 domain-containing protein [Bacteroidales bacterium]|nr:DUF4252 domain-containing protein [Bacteroidales bacterium]
MKTTRLWLLFAVGIALLLASGQVAAAQQAGSQKESLDSLLSLMKRYDGKENVSMMKLGRMAMTMGKTVGRAGSAWTRKVAKAFRRVDAVYMLDYGDSRVSLRDEIDSEVRQLLIRDNLVLTNRIGPEISDETFGETSGDGKHVSDLIIVMYSQSVVGIKGTVLSSDVERIVRRLNKQL